MYIHQARAQAGAGLWGYPLPLGQAQQADGLGFAVMEHGPVGITLQ